MKNFAGLLLCSLLGMLVGQDSSPAKSPQDRNPTPQSTQKKSPKLILSWADNYLTIRGPKLPQEGIRVHYLEAYCRPGSTDRNWAETVINHKTQLVSASAGGQEIKLRSTLADGVVDGQGAGRGPHSFEIGVLQAARVNPTVGLLQRHL